MLPVFILDYSFVVIQQQFDLKTDGAMQFNKNNFNNIIYRKLDYQNYIQCC